MRAAAFAFVGIASVLLLGCATNSSEREARCSRAVADPECPVDTPARIISDYDKDVSSIDDARCRALAGNSVEKYRKCLSDYRNDRR